MSVGVIGGHASKSNAINAYIKTISKNNNNNSSSGSLLNTLDKTIRQMSNDVTARTFAFNHDEAVLARDWQSYMSDTSHQREVDDLRRAGLNPVLSANGGASAYSASSASGSADNSAISMLASIYNQKMNNDNAYKIAQLNAKTQNYRTKVDKQIAELNNATQKYMNNNSVSATKYAADQNYYASKYSSDNSYNASIYGTDRSKYGLIDNFISGLFGNDKNNSNSGSKLGKYGNKFVNYLWTNYNR